MVSSIYPIFFPIYYINSSLLFYLFVFLCVLLLLFYAFYVFMFCKLKKKIVVCKERMAYDCEL